MPQTRSETIEDFIKENPPYEANIRFRNIMKVHLCANNVFGQEFFENNPSLQVQTQALDHLCMNDNLPVEFFAQWKLTEQQHTLFLENKAIPQQFHENNFDRISLYPWNFPPTLTPELGKIFCNPQLTYRFCERLVTEKHFPREYLLYRNDTPPDVVEKLSTDENLVHLVAGPFVTIAAANRYVQRYLNDPNIFYPYEFQDHFVKLLNNPKIPSSWFEGHFMEIHQRHLIDEFGSRFSLEFLRSVMEHLHDWQLPGILRNPYVTVPFIEELMPLINPNQFYIHVCANNTLPEKFFDNHWPQIIEIIQRNNNTTNALRHNLSANSGLSIAFFQRHPEALHHAITKNKFTYQLLLEEGQTEKQLIAMAQSVLVDDLSLPSLVVNVIQQEIEQLEYRRWYR